MPSYNRTQSVDAAPGGDSVKQACIDLDADLTGAFAAANDLDSKVSTHEGLTAAHGATGAVVGTTNVQTLTGKTLTAPNVNEAVALTATATQLNHVDATSSIQGQLDGKEPTITAGTTAQYLKGDKSLGTFATDALAAAPAETAATIGPLLDGSKGDITVSGSGAAWTVNANVITPAQLSRAGTAGQVLTSGGAGADPSYQAIGVAAGVSVTSSSNSVGYGTGAGGTVTQATSKGTGVTINKPCGTITTAADALAAGATVSFLVSNSVAAAGDVVIITSGSGSYNAVAGYVTTGSFLVKVTNATASTLSTAVAINFAIIKGASS